MNSHRASARNRREAHLERKTVTLVTASTYMPRRRSGRKQIHAHTITGQGGVNIIEAACLEMGFVWTPMGAIEAGIDGEIEIRDSTSGEVSNSIIRVQSKATRGAFAGETDTTFEFLCDERDLDYWMRGNTPVILVRSRTDTREAYWKSIKDYFRDPQRRKSRKIFFDKNADRFDASAAPQLRALAIPADQGAYFAPQLKQETLYSNLLEVTRLPTKLFHALTEHGSREAVREALFGYTKHPRRDFVAHGKTILSVNDLSTHPWNKIVDEGTVEEFDTADWADADDPQKRRYFVELLTLCLVEKLGPAHVWYHDKKRMFFFSATPHLSVRKIAYTSSKQRTEKEVFGERFSKRNAEKIAYYRHSAFYAQFVQHEGVWYLEIEPTYRFTSDGKRGDRYGAERLTGIKRLERNPSVLGQLHMWASVLAPEASLFGKPYPHLAFGRLATFSANLGLDDEAWLKREDEPLPEVTDATEPLFEL